MTNFPDIGMPENSTGGATVLSNGLRASHSRLSADMLSRNLGKRIIGTVPVMIRLTAIFRLSCCLRF